MLFRHPADNFGDNLNSWLWPQIAPEVCDPLNPVVFVGIGTILGADIPNHYPKVVFGSGCGGTNRLKFDPSWRIYAVRGRLTAAHLKLDPSLAITDPGILVRKVYNSNPAKRYRVSWMPHHQSFAEADWTKLSARTSMHCIDPRNPVEQILEEIGSSDLLLTEAMHGAIVADVLRVPWVPVKVYPQFLEFKWRDWAETMGINIKFTQSRPIYERPTFSVKGMRHTLKRLLAEIGLGKQKWRLLHPLPSSSADVARCLSQLDSIAKSTTPYMSDETVLEKRLEQLSTRLCLLRDDWQNGAFTMDHQGKLDYSTR